MKRKREGKTASRAFSLSAPAEPIEPPGITFGRFWKVGEHML